MKDARPQLLPLFLLLLVVFFISYEELHTNRSTMETVPYPETEMIDTIPSPLSEETSLLETHSTLSEYIEIVDSCGADYEGACVNLRSGPGVEYAPVSKLRNGIVLKVSEKVEKDGELWYRIKFDDWLRYPERVDEDWYVSAAFAVPFFGVGDEFLSSEATSSVQIADKKIIIDRSDQKLYAYDGESLFMESSVSTGLDITPTPRGTFLVYKKTPSRYMQGPIPGISTKEYDLPGVPWNLYFTAEGAVIHGAYWHDRFGTEWSNGCVNLPLASAKELYEWASIGTVVMVRD